MEDEPPQSSGVQYAVVKEWRAFTSISRKMKQQGQRGNNMQLWMCLVVKVKSDAVKNNIA